MEYLCVLDKKNGGVHDYTICFCNESSSMVKFLGRKQGENVEGVIIQLERRKVFIPLHRDTATLLADYTATKTDEAKPKKGNKKSKATTIEFKKGDEVIIVDPFCDTKNATVKYGKEKVKIPRNYLYFNPFN